MIYIFIFLSKVLENALGTLRLILVSNGKKVLGAILQLVIGLLWVYTTGLVINDIKSDFLKVIAFSIGSLIGSYIGSYLEEKIALGNNLFIVTCNSNSSDKIISELNNLNYDITVIKKGKKSIIIIVLKRKQKLRAIKHIKKFDRNAKIIISNAQAIYNNLNL